MPSLHHKQWWSCDLAAVMVFREEGWRNLGPNTAPISSSDLVWQSIDPLGDSTLTIIKPQMPSCMPTPLLDTMEVMVTLCQQ